MKQTNHLRAILGHAIRSLLVAFLSLAIANAQSTRETFDDKEVAHAVKTQLVLDSHIIGHELAAKSAGGVLTLSGRVDNVLAKQRAVQIAVRTRGVRSVIDLIEVAPPEIPDKYLRADIQQALDDEAATEPLDVVVVAKSGIITLKGKVQSQTERWLAERAASGVRGVRDVVNELEIDPPHARADAEIAEDVSRRLSSSAWIESERITVDVRQGHVALGGAVPTSAQHLAARNAAWVGGVRSVTFRDLKVSPNPGTDQRKKRRVSDVSDEEIEAAVAATMRLDPRLGRTEISVTSKDQTVTLRGSVPTTAAKQLVEEAAWNTFGVMEVVNNTEVAEGQTLTNEEIKSQIVRMLSVDPYVNRYDLHVTLRDGQPFIHGNVDSQFEKLRVQEIAARVPGVLFIQNRLEVAEDTRKSDEAIREFIRQRLEWDSSLGDARIDFGVEDGVVTLSGEVSTPQVRNKIKSIAHDAGALRVQDQMTIRR